eukprot:COSAG02_NODE_1634_length_11565_cov_4.754666_8_plen_83_part_00
MQHMFTNAGGLARNSYSRVLCDTHVHNRNDNWTYMYYSTVHCTPPTVCTHWRGTAVAPGINGRSGGAGVARARAARALDDVR